jgi:glucose-1-phosphate thymidylyltransferase
MFEELLGDGSRLGMRFSYKVQEVPNGLAQAFVLGAEFLEGGPGCLILGDNLFYGQGFTKMLRQAVLSLDPQHDMPEQPNPAHKHATTMEDLKARIMHLGRGACIFGYEVSDPRAYGVVEFDHNGKVLSLEEKPQQPKSNYAVPGLYFYDKTVCEKAAALRPSARGEYEITDLNKVYLEEGTLRVQLFGRGFAWLDTGNCDSLLEAGNFVATIQNRQGFYVACIEEIAWRNGWITTEELKQLGAGMKTQYGRYLEHLASK